MTDEVRRLRGQLSSLQSLLTLSRLMADSGEVGRIVELAGTAVPSLSRCRLLGVHREGTGWALVGPATEPAAMAELADALQRLTRHGGAVPWAEAPCWTWAYPIQGAAGHGGFLVVSAAAEPPTDERFVLQALAQQTGVALANVELRAEERAAAVRALQAKRDADQANAAKSEFLSRMSHELRTPLNAVLGFGQLLWLDDLADTQRRNVDQILRGGRHLLALIDEVLDLSRVENGDLALAPEAIAVADALEETVDLIRPLAAERDLHVRAPSARDCAGTVEADPQRLRQVLLNLASNAVKYNRDGGTITLSCQPGGPGRIRILVQDTGPGIPADRIERLFVPFDRLGAEQTDIPGTGMGLALSKRLVEAMDGTLGADSVEGEGTTFTVELALAEASVGRGPASSPAVRGPTRDRGAGPERTVLYVEDNPDNLQLVEDILAWRGGVRLLTATRGLLADDLARRHRPDLVLLDLHLPDIDGEEVLRRLRADPVTATLPVVVVSADATDGRAARLVGAGARAYLTKPLEVARLLEVLDEVLELEAAP